MFFLEIASERTSTKRSAAASVAALSSLKSRKPTESIDIYLYIYIRDRSIDRMGKFVSENRWKKKSRYWPGVTVMRLSTDSLLRHHINIRSNLFERIFPRAARPEILSRSTATFYTRWLIPPFADIQPRFPIVQTRYVSVYESTPTHPIQIPSVRIENRFRHELIIDKHRVRKPGTNSSIEITSNSILCFQFDRSRFINFLKIISSETRECRGIALPLPG